MVLRGIIVPAYFKWWRPEGQADFDRLIAAADLVPIVAIINPNSGPLDKSWTFYADMKLFIEEFQKKGGIAFGYVSTDYSNRPMTDVEHDIDLWKEQGLVDGIFLDEAESAFLPLLQGYAQRAKVQFRYTPILNFGTYTARDTSEYIDIVAETDESTYLSQDIEGLHPKQAGVFIHGTTQHSRKSIQKAIDCDVKWIYTTPIKLEDGPWGKLSPDFDDLVGSFKFCKSSSTNIKQLEDEKKKAYKQLAAYKKQVILIKTKIQTELEQLERISNVN